MREISVYKRVVHYGGNRGKHEAIVDEETWERANKGIGNGREDDTGLYYTDPHIHLLKGILRCGAGGQAMTRYRSGKKTRAHLLLDCACVDPIKKNVSGRTTSPVNLLPARKFEALIK
jgi:hypothetical protein